MWSHKRTASRIQPRHFVSGCLCATSKPPTIFAMVPFKVQAPVSRHPPSGVGCIHPLAVLAVLARRAPSQASRWAYVTLNAIPCSHQSEAAVSETSAALSRHLGPASPFQNNILASSPLVDALQPLHYIYPPSTSTIPTYILHLIPRVVCSVLL